MTIEQVRRIIEEAGWGSSIDATDPGRVRVHDWDDDGRATKVVGEVVIREDRVVYAEMGGRVFAFWPTDSDHARDEKVAAWRLALEVRS